MQGRLPTVAFCGWGRAGKDTAGELLAELTPLRYVGSLSWVGLPHMAKVLGICDMLAWERRHKERMRWKEELDAFRRDDPTRLIRMSLERGEIVVGIRDRVELLAARRDGLLDFCVWIERPGTPVDPTVTYTHLDCDVVLQNAGTLEDLRAELLAFCHVRGIPRRGEGVPERGWMERC